MNLELSKCCRLCMNMTDLLVDLYKMDGDTSLHMKIVLITELKICPEDGLPSVICNGCEMNINNMYDFKQKCREIDLKLRSIINHWKSSYPNSNFNTDIENKKAKHEIEEATDKPHDFLTYYQSWLSESTKPDNAKLPSILVNHPCIEMETSRITQPTTVDDNLLINEKSEYDQTYGMMYLQSEKIESPHQTQNTFQCEHCGKMFETIKLLEKHITFWHSNIKLYSCKICFKRFTREAHKDVHLRSHSGIRPYICEICGSSSIKRQDLIRHLKIHSDERKYACPQCERRFKRSSDVHSHMRTHTGARPYCCNICEKSYTSHSGLRKHRKTHCRK